MLYSPLPIHHSPAQVCDARNDAICTAARFLKISGQLIENNCITNLTVHLNIKPTFYGIA